jgi:hypothetical protein
MQHQNGRGRGLDLVKTAEDFMILHRKVKIVCVHSVKAYGTRWSTLYPSCFTPRELSPSWFIELTL